jgi:hypothetical protein
VAVRFRSCGAFLLLICSSLTTNQMIRERNSKYWPGVNTPRRKRETLLTVPCTTSLSERRMFYRVCGVLHTGTANKQRPNVCLRTISENRDGGHLRLRMLMHYLESGDLVNLNFVYTSERRQLTINRIRSIFLPSRRPSARRCKCHHQPNG